MREMVLHSLLALHSDTHARQNGLLRAMNLHHLRLFPAKDVGRFLPLAANILAN
jgi:hypothetical protein